MGKSRWVDHFDRTSVGHSDPAAGRAVAVVAFAEVESAVEASVVVTDHSWVEAPSFEEEAHTGAP